MISRSADVLEIPGLTQRYIDYIDVEDVLYRNSGHYVYNIITYINDVPNTLKLQRIQIFKN